MYKSLIVLCCALLCITCSEKSKSYIWVWRGDFLKKIHLAKPSPNTHILPVQPDLTHFRANRSTHFLRSSYMGVGM